MPETQATPSAAPAPWQLTYAPALDGLRAIAVSLVFVTHAVYEPFTAGGSAGVTAFFTLSGFLITSLLLGEIQRTGTIDFRRFYVRRARRLFPAMYAAIILIALFSLVTHKALDISMVAGAAVYLGNFPAIFGAEDGLLSHMWSLAVEEQFYVVWPFVLWVLLRWTRSRTAVAAVLVLGVIASATLRAVLYDGSATDLRVYLGTDTRADALLIGCLLALFMHGRVLKAPSPAVTVVALVAALAAFIALGFGTHWWFFVALPTIVPWLTVVVIRVVTTARWTPVLTWAPLVKLGQRSYGFYLWHLPVVEVVARAVPNKIPGVPFIVWFVLAAVLSWIVTLLSWHFIERPFLAKSQRELRDDVHGTPSTSPVS